MSRIAIFAVCLLAAVAGGSVAAADSGPMADAGLDQTVTVDTTVQLDATGSYHPNGEITAYEWTITTPDGQETTPDCTECERTQFTPETTGRYEVSVTVTDENGMKTTDTLFVYVEDAGPDVELSGDTSPEIGQQVVFEATAESPDAELEEVVWFVDDQIVGVNALDAEQARSGMPLAFASTTRSDVEVLVRDTNDRTATDELAVRPQSSSSPATSTPSSTGDSTEPALDCADPDYASENPDECFTIDQESDVAIQMRDTISTCPGEGVRVSPTVDAGPETSYSGSWDRSMPFSSDEYGRHTLTYTVTTEDGRTASEQLMIEVVQCETTGGAEEDVVVVSGTENTVANAVSREHIISISDADPVDEQTNLEMLEHAGAGFVALGDAGRDIATGGNEYVMEIELTGSEAAEIVERIEETDGGAWVGHGNEIAIDGHKVLAEGEVHEGLVDEDVDKATLVVAVDHDDVDGVIQEYTESEEGAEQNVQSEDWTGVADDVESRVDIDNARTGYTTPDRSQPAETSQSSSSPATTSDQGDYGMGHTTGTSMSSGSATESDIEDTSTTSVSDTTDQGDYGAGYTTGSGTSSTNDPFSGLSDSVESSNDEDSNYNRGWGL